MNYSPCSSKRQRKTEEENRVIVHLSSALNPFRCRNCENFISPVTL